MEIKKCKACGEEKNIDDFPKYKAKGICGHRSVCRLCWNKKWTPIVVNHTKRYRDENEEYRKKHREDAARQYQREKPNGQWWERCKLYETRHPDRAKAKIKVRNAIKYGKIISMPCEKCGKKAHAHHEDYSKPLEIKWLCPYHHGERHRVLNKQGSAKT